MSKLEEIDEAFAEGKTEEEIKAAIDAAMVEDSMTGMEKLRRDNPALNEAWEQIKTIRALTAKQQAQINAKPAWERHYFEIVEGIETDNEALREAWNKYYVLKTLTGI